MTGTLAQGAPGKVLGETNDSVLRCTVQCVQYIARFRVECLFYSAVLYNVNSAVLCNVYSAVLCTVYSTVLCTVYSTVLCTVCSAVLCTVYSAVPCTAGSKWWVSADVHVSILVS